jgi:hypothetical protein
MSTHNNHPVLPRTQIESPEERYDPEPRRDWVRAAITLSLIFALLAISGVALYSAHGDFDKTKGLLDKLLPNRLTTFRESHPSSIVVFRLSLRLRTTIESCQMWPPVFCRAWLFPHSERSIAGDVLALVRRAPPLPKLK